MNNINIFIKENVKKIGKDMHITPNIPEKKLNNAIKAFKCESFYESIIAIYDDTIFGASDEGLVITGEKIIFKEDFSDPVVIEYSNIESVEYIEEIKENKKRKFTKIVLKNGNKIELSKPTMGDFNHKEFANFLNKIVTEFDEYKEENQLKTISEMPDELKIAYLKIIVNMTFEDDEKIDEKELAEIFLLMTRLELKKESRFKIRSYIAQINRDNIESTENLVEIIKNSSESSQHKSIMVSLVKDLINVYFSSKDTTKRDFEFLSKNKNIFGLTEEEIKLAFKTVETDYEILKQDLDDDKIKENMKELASKAAAAGVPLAAVYISGSVIGLSAAGITSGLATLGLGLGMTGGIAVVGLIGVLSYKGVQYLTGANELDKYKTKELMLHNVIKLNQKTISMIIEDINYLIEKLNNLIIEHNKDKKKIEKLVYIIAQFQGALSSINSKSDTYQNSLNRLKVPKTLDKERLKSLTEEPTKKPLYDFVIANYELKEIEIDNQKVKKFVLKENIETEILEKMSDIFKGLGYFNMDNILKSKASSVFKEIFG